MAGDFLRQSAKRTMQIDRRARAPPKTRNSTIKRNKQSPPILGSIGRLRFHRKGRRDNPGKIKTVRAAEASTGLFSLPPGNLPEYVYAAGRTKELSADWLAALSGSFRIVRMLWFGETRPTFRAFNSSTLMIAPMVSREGARRDQIKPYFSDDHAFFAPLGHAGVDRFFRADSNRPLAR